MGTLESIVERHRAFWRRENREPLLAELPHPGWEKKPYPLSGGRVARDPTRLMPGDVDIDRLFGADHLTQKSHTGDFIHGVKTVYPVAYMESLIGCPIYAGDTSCYARPCESESTQIGDSHEVRIDEEWRTVLDTVVLRAVELAQGRFPALQLHLRGTVDMVAAYLGEERMCLGMFDDPAALSKLVGRFTDLYIETALRGQAQRPPWQRGYVSSWGIYSPEPILDYQVDATSILSLKQYETFFRARDREILSRFATSVVHLHSCGLHIAPAIADISRGKAVEISLDREAGAFHIDEILEVSRMLLERDVRVIIHGELYLNEVDEMLESISPSGVAIFYWKPKPGEVTR